MVTLLHAEAWNSEDSSNWQSCSDDLGSSPPSFQNFGVDASTRTLNLSLVDRVAHEPSDVDYPPFAELGGHSIRSHPSSQSASAQSPEDTQQPCNTHIHAVFGDVNSPLRTSFAFLRADASRPVFLLPSPSYYIPSTVWPATFAGMDTVNVPELVERLGSEEDAVRKMAVFKLQSNIGDPSFAEIFIQEGGLEKLKYLAMRASGNTLAYSLTSFSRLLEVDKGWDFVEQDLIERVGKSTLSADILHG